MHIDFTSSVKYLDPTWFKLWISVSWEHLPFSCHFHHPKQVLFCCCCQLQLFLLLAHKNFLTTKFLLFFLVHTFLPFRFFSSVTPNPMIYKILFNWLRFFSPPLFFSPNFMWHCLLYFLWYSFHNYYKHHSFASIHSLVSSDEN